MPNKIDVGKKIEVENSYDDLLDGVTRYVVQKERDNPGITVEYKEDDIIELEYSDGTTWIGAAKDLRKISGVKGKKRDADDSSLPLELIGEDATRGIGSVILTAFSVFTKKSKKVSTSLHEVVSNLEDFIKEEGLYTVDPKFQLSKVTGTLTSSTSPYLLFIHGTLSSTEGSFDRLIKNSEDNIWGQLVSTYKHQIIALEHKTLTKSPLQNVLDMIQHFPDNITLHVVSHSRGGIVGDVLCACQHGTMLLSKSVDSTRTEDVRVIKEIEKTIRAKQIKVERFVRVACPAAGTTLLSDKYVDYLNALVNVIRVAAPGYGEVVNKIKKIIVAIYSLKDNHTVLPGLESMVPNGGFQRMLNYPTLSLDASLAVIAGDGVASFSLKGLGTILFNLFYLHENDWVVDTDSMDKGIHRKATIYKMLTQHKEVNHFSYFNNKDSRNALITALTTDQSEWKKYFTLQNQTSTQDRGLLSKWQTGEELATPADAGDVSGKKPVIVLIPGILGSNLYEVSGTKHAKPNKIFLADGEMIRGGFVSKLDLTNPKSTIEALSVAGKFYGPFYHYFKENYDVVIFPYDWRKPIKDAAQKLANQLRVIQQKAGNQCIHIVAHSMGGLVARHLMVVDKPLFQQISGHSDFKFIFLGSPLKGAYIVPQILLGQGIIFKSFAAIDWKHDTHDLMRVFKDYKGLLNLLPIQEEHRDFVNPHSNTWIELKSTDEHFEIPDIQSLKEFVNEVVSVQTELYTNKKVFYIAGTSDKTLCDYELAESFFKGTYVQFLSTNKGDGKVTWATGIPKEIKDDNRVFYVDTIHGDLAADEDNFSGIAELLRTGRTQLLSATEPMDRGAGELISYHNDPELFSRDLSAIEEGLFGKRRARKVNQQPVLNVAIKCGDLKYTRFPIMVGHFKNDAIVSAERVVDGYLNKRLSMKHELKIYPEEIGSSDIFFNTSNKPASIVVGLGEMEKLTGSKLERTITQGALNYILTCSNRSTEETFGLSVILIGSSYAGLSLETSLKSIINGIQNANTMLHNRGSGMKLISELEVVELYEDKAVQALKFLVNETESNRFNNNLRLVQKKINKVQGRRKRILSENREDWWSQMRIVRTDDQRLLKKDMMNFEYSASSLSAKVDKRNNIANMRVINANIEQLASQQTWDLDKAKLIFELLVPNDFKTAVRNQQHIQLQLDFYSAQIPWELLHDTRAYVKPLATQVGIIRRLEFENVNVAISYVNENTALVIGDPDLGNPEHQLPGARKEAELVRDLFTINGLHVKPLIFSDDISIINELNMNQYKILHLAGHGNYDEHNDLNSGMLIGDGIYLSNVDIQNLWYVPDLVFINCCHIGKVTPEGMKNSMNKHGLAASLSLELIKKGVKCIIAAAWAVDDMAAKNFTETFYDLLLRDEDRKNFGEAVRGAREDTFMKFGNKNTWAAYQCYGDQFYMFDDKQGSSYKKSPYYDEEEVKVDLENLLLRMDVDKDDLNFLVSKIEEIKKRVEESKIPMSSILYYLVGKCYAELRYYEDAEHHLELAIKRPGVKLPDDAEEKLCLMRYKKYFFEMSTLGKSSVDMNKNIQKMKEILAVNNTADRFNLLGSSLKTMACFEKNTSKRNGMLKHSAAYYEQGYNKIRLDGGNIIYPLSNMLAIQYVSHFGKKDQRVAAYLKQLALDFDTCKDKLDPTDFWDLMAKANMLFVKTLLTIRSKTYHENFELLKEAIKHAWKEGGTISKKLAELEHLDILMGLFGHYPTASVKLELKFLEELKSYINQLQNADKLHVFD